MDVWMCLCVYLKKVRRWIGKEAKSGCEPLVEMLVLTRLSVRYAREFYGSAEMVPVCFGVCLVSRVICVVALCFVVLVCEK